MFNKNLIVLIIVWKTKKESENIFNRFFDCYLKISILSNIINYLNIARQIFENVDLKKKDVD